MFYFLIIFFALAIFTYLIFKFKGLPVVSGLKIKTVYRYLISGALALALIVASMLTQSILLGLLIYIFIMYLLTDLINFFMKLVFKNKKAFTIWKKIYCKGILAIGFAVVFSIYGYWNAFRIKQTEYDIDTNNTVFSGEELEIALITDIHLGTTVDLDILKDIVSRVNGLSPDIIILGGDIYDEGTSSNEIEASYDILKDLKSEYGIYFITGNHEYYLESSGTDLDSIIKNLNNIGITTLLDDHITVNNKFNILGRIDGGLNDNRRELGELVDEIDNDLPVILLDHQPKDLKKAGELGIVLQLSGHTHDGQIFPVNYISPLFKFNEYHYGHYNNEKYNLIVSAGAGTWGFPMRIGTRSEIVFIKLK